MPVIMVLLFFLFFGATLAAAGLGLKVVESQRKRQIAQILKSVAPEKARAESRILVGPDPQSRTGILEKFGPLRRLATHMQAAGVSWSLAGVLAGMAALGAGGAVLGGKCHVLIYPEASMIALALAGIYLPIFIIERKRKKRIAEFEKQLPEALDFIARAVKSGHALSVSLELLANEFSDPLRAEFKKIFHELSLGAAFDVALRNLVERVPLIDVRFFVSAVLLQRETGGNLAEMLSKLAYVMRERFRVKGAVRAASADGRITAGVLTVMPLALSFGLMAVSPDYIPSMVRDPIGKILLVASILGQGLGYLCLKKIINIKV
jgi:tight adherence protein B